MNVRFGDKETCVQIPVLPLSKCEIYKEHNLSKFVSLSLKGRKRTYIVIHLSVLKFITNANPIAWLLTRDGHLTKGYWTELMVSGIHSSLFYPLSFSLHWNVFLPLCRLKPSHALSTLVWSIHNKSVIDEYKNKLLNHKDQSLLNIVFLTVNT